MVTLVFYTDEIPKVLHDRFQGSGRPLLFLLHGLNTDSNKFSKPADFEVLTFIVLKVLSEFYWNYDSNF